MLRKSISWALTLALLLSCTVFASAESFTVSEYAGDPVLRTMDAAKLDEAKEAIIATLPEDMRDKEYTLTSGGDETGNNILLVSTERMFGQEVQQLIDSKQITEEDVQNFPDDTIYLYNTSIVAPFIEDENGNIVNAIVARSSTYTSTGFQGGTDPYNPQYALYGNLQYFLHVRDGDPLTTGVRPSSLWVKYSNSGSSTVTRLYANYGVQSAKLVEYPEYYYSNGGSSNVIDNDYNYAVDFTINNPTKNQIYYNTINFSTNRSLSPQNYKQGFKIYAYVGQSKVAELIYGWSI